MKIYMNLTKLEVKNLSKNIWSKRRRNKPNFDLVQLSMKENTGRARGAL